jgi:hypothetical protein
MILKMQNRSNAKFTPEENAVLDKYGIKRDNWGRQLTVDGVSINPGIDTKTNSIYDWKTNKRTTSRNADVDKINYADRARKIDSRKYAQDVRDAYRGRETFQASQRRLDSQNMYKDVQAMKDLLLDRRYNKDNIEWSKERYNDNIQKSLDDFNQSIEAINKWLPDAKERNQKRLDKAQQTIDSLLVKESYTNTDECRVIPTGLVGDINKDILNSVIGQMSDGMWENSPGMAGYWTFADIDDNNNILVNKAYGNYMGTRLNNPYVGMSEEDVKNFFANKIKAIAQQYLHDQNINPYREWNSSNTEKCSYLDYDTGVTIADAYAAYKALKK